jgi:hypothetical protein
MRITAGTLLLAVRLTECDGAYRSLTLWRTSKIRRAASSSPISNQAKINLAASKSSSKRRGATIKIVNVSRVRNKTISSAAKALSF